MSFKVNLYTLSKRDNSTKQPTGTGTEFNCVMKAGSGIMHPVLSFDLGLTSDPSQYNYAYIPAFERYYFIEEWYFNQALWTATLKVDVLATYKTAIGGSSLYVLRAAGESDGNIIDTLYPAKSGCSFASDTKSNPWTSGMTYVIGIVSQSATCGTQTHYGLLRSAFTDICQWLLSDVVTSANGFSVNDASLELQRSLVEPLQFIKSCVLIPLPIGDTHGNTGQTITVYGWTTPYKGKLLNENDAIVKTYTFNIQKHPDTVSRGNYVNSAPFTAVTLTIPPFGTFNLDTSVTCNASTVDVTIRIDQITGKGTLTVMCNNIVLNRIEAQIGVPISMSSVSREILGTVSDVGGAIGGAVSNAVMGNVPGAIASVLSGVGNAVQTIQARANTIGTTGSYGSLLGDFRLDHQFFRPVADDNTHNGRPLCEVRQINNLSGYMIVQDGDVTINGTSAEDSMIRNYLESGFYYE